MNDFQGQTMGLLLTSKRNRWLLGIALVGLATAMTAKNVTSYPTECVPEATAEKGLEYGLNRIS